MLRDLTEIVVVISIALLITWPFEKAYGQGHDLSTHCYIYADYAIVSRAMAESGLSEPAQTAILDRIYRVPESLKRSFKMLFDLAQSDKRSARDFATAIGTRCIEMNGKPEAFLGVGT